MCCKIRKWRITPTTCELESNLLLCRAKGVETPKLKSRSEQLSSTASKKPLGGANSVFSLSPCSSGWNGVWKSCKPKGKEKGKQLCDWLRPSNNTFSNRSWKMDSEQSINTRQVHLSAVHSRCRFFIFHSFKCHFYFLFSVFFFIIWLYFQFLFLIFFSTADPSASSSGLHCSGLSNWDDVVSVQW